MKPNRRKPQFAKLIPAGIFALLLLTGTLEAHAALGRSKPNFEILQADFGIFYKLSEDSWRFQKTKVIPSVPGFTYGWRIRLITFTPTLRWKEVLELPAAPAFRRGGTEPSLPMSFGKLAVTEGTVSSPGEWIFHAWSVSGGVPSGKHVLQLYLDGFPVKKFEFEIRSHGELPSARD